MRRLLRLAAIPALLAATTALAVPAPRTFAATDGLTETGSTTYELVPDANAIKVSVSVSLKNSKPDLVQTVPCPGGTCIDTTRYYWNSTSIWVEAEAANITATSNAGAVSQSVVETTKFYRIIKLSFPNVYYGQTRTVSVSYTIPGGAPRSDSFTRAGKAYASFCVGGNGRDGGSVTAVFPTGYEVEVASGDSMTSSSAGGKQTFASGSLDDPVKFYACLTATNSAALTKSSLAAGGQPFQIQAWPEDKQWVSQVQGDVTAEFTKLQDMIGLPVDGTGAITITEEAPSSLGDYSGFYDPKTRTAGVSENADEALVAHELSHIWFNDGLFKEHWMGEGFAGYAEKVAGPGKYEACKDPGKYPVSGQSPNLGDWKYLGPKATTQEQQVVDFQYAASCWIVTTVGDAIGDARMREVLGASANGEIAYVGAGAPETVSGDHAVDSKRLLDLFDERGMVPAGVTDLDKIQKLFAAYGILADAAQLEARSTSRAAYHELETAAGTWKLPFAIRGPMSSWTFEQADAAMTTAKEIVALRDKVKSLVPAAALDGTAAQKAFEGATTQSELDTALADMQREAQAAEKVASAQKAYDANRGPLESIGLLGADVKTPMTKATDALKAARADEARTNAEAVLTTLNGAGNAGILRAGVATAIVLLLLLLIFFLVFRRRRRRHALALAAAGAPAMVPAMDPAAGEDAAAWGQAAPQAPAEAEAPQTLQSAQTLQPAQAPQSADVAQTPPMPETPQTPQTPEASGPPPEDPTARWTLPPTGANPDRS